MPYTRAVVVVYSLGLVLGFVLLLPYKDAKHLKAINLLNAQGAV